MHLWPVWGQPRRFHPVARQGLLPLASLVVRGMIVNQPDADPAEATTDLRQTWGGFVNLIART